MPARQATAVLEARGSFKGHANRRRERAGEPKVDKPIGDPPVALNGSQHRAWLEIVEACPPGVLTQVDRQLVELTCKLIADMRGNWAKFTAAQMGQLRGCLAQLGMTPVDRSRLKIEQPKDQDDPWADL